MEQITKGVVKLDAYKYYTVKIMEELKRREKYFDSMTTLKELKENSDDNSINISFLALKKLEELGFKKESFSTEVLANMIENIYHERSMFDESSYFDLSLPDNPHYKYLADKYMIGNEKVFRGLIAGAIGSSNCETKNINDLVFGVTNSIIKEIDKDTSKKKL